MNFDLIIWNESKRKMNTTSSLGLAYTHVYYANYSV